jgi:hypothetical protein
MGMWGHQKYNYGDNHDYHFSHVIGCKTPIYDIIPTNEATS